MKARGGSAKKGKSGHRQHGRKSAAYPNSKEQKQLGEFELVKRGIKPLRSGFLNGIFAKARGM